jgi:hypothetical protein
VETPHTVATLGEPLETFVSSLHVVASVPAAMALSSYDRVIIG